MPSCWHKYQRIATLPAKAISTRRPILDVGCISLHEQLLKGRVRFRPLKDIFNNSCACIAVNRPSRAHSWMKGWGQIPTCPTDL